MFLVIRKPREGDTANYDDVIGLYHTLEAAKEGALDYISDYRGGYTTVIYEIENMIGEFVLKPRELAEV
jgi:hypothetical protein